MVLYTERLTLKEVTASDLEYVHKLHSLPETDRYNTLGIPGSVDETRILVGHIPAFRLRPEGYRILHRLYRFERQLS